MKVCSACKEPKPSSEYHRNSCSKDDLQSRCKECNTRLRRAYYRENKEAHTNYHRNRRARIRETIREYVRSKECVDCGERDPVVLEFDHLRDKRFSISYMVRSGYGLSTIMEEIGKCEIRCANCHRRKTVGKFWITGS